MSKAQKGQVLVLALLVLMVLGGLLLRVFYVGQVNYQVVRQRHALDAATYSAAVLQAQTLNYAAYMNRAYAGHQVAMAHLVTLASWTHFAVTQAQRVQKANPPSSLITMMFGPQHGLAYQSAVVAAAGAAPTLIDSQLKQLFIQHQSYSPFVFEPHSQMIYHDWPAQRELVLRSVLQDNYTELPLQQQPDLMQLSIEEDNWSEVMTWHAAEYWQPWLKELVNHYDFLQQRHYTAKNPWVVQARCPHKRHELRRRGQTQLTNQGDWQAEDTLSFHALRANRWIGCYYREYAMGWAWVHGASEGKNESNEVVAPETFADQDFWRWVQEQTDWNIHDGTDNGLAHSWSKRDQIKWPGRGLQPYLALVAPESLRFKTRLALQVSTEMPWIHSHSEAQTYYEIPPALFPSIQTKPNLFQPYWQAALINTQWKQRLQSLLGDL